ncbi:HD domain-containing protein [Candidatus Woesearchaeota archaeon]|nr:HD domain-containing protein [Candidatus Woesearchaeota archaeon]
MDNINGLRKLYQLKNVERACSVWGRKESTAEHSWSCLILADYFLSSINKPELNRLKVYELLMYHDVVEIETGDVNITNEKMQKGKQKREQEAMHVLKEHIPAVLRQKFVNLFTEFEEQKTAEAKFAKAIDALDAEIHELDYKDDWKGWTEEFLRRKKQPLFETFPELRATFEKTIQFCREHGYFTQ